MPDFSAGDVSGDLEAVYVAALERLDAIRQAWFDEDQPLIGQGSTGQQVEHPLVRLLRDSEAHVAKLGAMVRARGMGRPQVAVFRGKLGLAPAAKLRTIKSAQKR